MKDTLLELEETFGSRFYFFKIKLLLPRQRVNGRAEQGQHCTNVKPREDWNKTVNLNTHFTVQLWVYIQQTPSGNSKAIQIDFLLLNWISRHPVNLNFQLDVGRLVVTLKFQIKIMKFQSD